MNGSETKENSVNENSDDDDDDAEEYFLQATPGAYDIKEKIRLANDELFEDCETYGNIIREQRVSFKEDLVDYEPDYSSDDGYVESPDALSLSDNENEHIYDQDQQKDEHRPLEPISETPNVESYDTEDENSTLEIENPRNENDECEVENVLNEDKLTPTQLENVDEKLQENLEEAFKETIEETKGEDENVVEEEIFTDSSENNEHLKSECSKKISTQLNEDNTSDDDEEEITEEEKSVEIIEIMNDTEDDLEETRTDDTSEVDVPLPAENDGEENTEETLENKTCTNKMCPPKIDRVNCHIHCLEKKDLDLITGASKSAANISKGPALKLRQRPCCTNQKSKPRLPVYNGLISEYGLTRAQLEKRKSRKKESARRKREKSKRVSEEKKQKDTFNEEVFCAWLKTVRQRSQSNNNSNKENRKSKNPTPRIRQRPKTCNVSVNAKEKVRRRPNTSPCKSCSYTTILVTPTVTIREVLTFKKKVF